MSPESYNLPDKEYIAARKKAFKDSGHPEDFYSDKAILHTRDIFRKIHEDPSLEFKYVKDLDSVCHGCEHKSKCVDPKHEYYGFANKADEKAIENIPALNELESSKNYTGSDLIKLFKKMKIKADK